MSSPDLGFSVMERVTLVIIAGIGLFAAVSALTIGTIVLLAWGFS